jgi:DNA-binding transcriptional LysR family regulator
VLVVPAGHALAAVERPTLEQLAEHTLVLYHPTVTGRTRIDQAFERARLKPLVALEAIDSDVIKTYVRLGLGVGIVTELAMRDESRPNPASSRAPWATCLAPMSRAWPSSVAPTCASLCLPLQRCFRRGFRPAFIECAMNGQGTDYQL